jgi:hypothetical protein
MTMKRRREMKMMETLTTATRVLRFKYDCEKYRRYAEAKAKIPKDLSPREYEEQIRLLCKRFKI